MATYGVAVSRTEYIQGQCYSSWPCGHISATILCVVACGVITFRCAEASLKRQHLHATWKRRATKRMHALMHARTHARTRVVHAHVSNVESIKKKRREREGERKKKKHAAATFRGSRATMASCFIPAGRPAVCLDYGCTNESSSSDSIVPVFQFCVAGIVARHDIFTDRSLIILADCFP